MTHKEEAIKRVEEFCDFVNCDANEPYEKVYSREVQLENARFCALISIAKEIKLIENLISPNQLSLVETQILSDLTKVKQEIENL